MITLASPAFSTTHSAEGALVLAAIAVLAGIAFGVFLFVLMVRYLLAGRAAFALYVRQNTAEINATPNLGPSRTHRLPSTPGIGTLPTTPPADHP